MSSNAVIAVSTLVLHDDNAPPAAVVLVGGIDLPTAAEDIVRLLLQVSPHPRSAEDIEIRYQLMARLYHTVRKASGGNNPFLRLPPEIFDNICDIVGHRNPKAVANIMGVCRQTWTGVNLNMALWMDVADAPTWATRFRDSVNCVLARRNTLDLTLDAHNFGIRLPNPALLLSTFASLRSLTIQHHMDVYEVVQELAAIGNHPLIRTLIITPEGGVSNAAQLYGHTLEQLYPRGAPVFNMPNLVHLELHHCYAAFPNSPKLRVFKTDNGTTVTDTPSYNGWPADLLLEILSNAPDLEVLHLNHATVAPPFAQGCGAGIFFPELSEMMLAGARPRDLSWLLARLGGPRSAYVSVTVGNRRHKSSNTQEFGDLVNAMRRFDQTRSFMTFSTHHRQGCHSICFSKDERVWVPTRPSSPTIYLFDMATSPGAYAPQPGAIDLTVAWHGPDVKPIRWTHMLRLVTPFVDLCTIRFLEYKPHAVGLVQPERRALEEFKNVVGLRLWSTIHNSLDFIIFNMIDAITTHFPVYLCRFGEVFPHVQMIRDARTGFLATSPNRSTLLHRVRTAFSLSLDAMDTSSDTES